MHLFPVAAQASRFHSANLISSPAKLLTVSSSSATPCLRQSAPSWSTRLSRPVVVSWWIAATWEIF
jgi:hypothetical protein